MTHARIPGRANAAAGRPPAFDLAATLTSVAAPAAVRPDPEGLADRRRLADALDCSDGCAHEACRRARRCRGPRGTTAAFPGAVLPSCLATGFDELHGPVARWAALMDMIAAAEARLAELSPRS